MVEEKKSNANQTFCIVDDAIKKLNSDIEKFETLLKTTGQYETAVPTGGALPNDLAAIQVTPNSQDWILAKVISHDAQTGMYNLSDEDIESNKSTWFVVFWWLLSSFVVRNGIQSSSQIHNSKYLQYVYLS